jgi:hypothetical protein
MKTILLARPHPFIVGEMSPWLEQAGFGVRKSETLVELSTLVTDADCAVISLAVSSSIGATAEEVLSVLRTLKPGLRIAFAALRSLQQVTPDICRIASAIGISASVVGVDSVSTSARFVGQSTCFVYISKDDLVDPVRKQKARSLLLMHVS